MTISLIRIKFLTVSVIALMLLTGCPSCGYDWNCSGESIRKTSGWKRTEACSQKQRSLAGDILKDDLSLEDKKYIFRRCIDNSSYQFEKDKKYFP